MMDAFGELRRVGQVDVRARFHPSSKEARRHAQDRGEQKGRLMPDPIERMDVLVQQWARDVDFTKKSAKVVRP
jgi:hypothetical protein